MGVPDEDLQLKSVFLKLVLYHYCKKNPHIALAASAFPRYFSLLKGKGNTVRS